MAMRQAASFGDELRIWRQRRRLSQMELAGEAELSTRHLSFLETGRARPSRATVLRLAEELAVPLREQNVLLVAAGFAPVHEARPLDHPDLAAARGAIDRIIDAMSPNPALAIDRHWTMIAANATVLRMVEGVDPTLLEPPVNVLRLALHPNGLAPRTLDFGAWRAHLLRRLAHEVDTTGDATLAVLLAELEALPASGPRHPVGQPPFGGIALPFRIRMSDTDLAFITTTTVFGGPADVTVSELAIESFFPADAATAAWLSGTSA